MGSFPERVLAVLHSTRKSRHVLLLSQVVHFEVEFTQLYLQGLSGSREMNVRNQRP